MYERTGVALMYVRKIPVCYVFTFLKASFICGLTVTSMLLSYAPSRGHPCVCVPSVASLPL